MNLHLVDINLTVVEAWRSAFRQYPEVSIQQENILAVAEGTIVSPANSYGFMDGGIDAVYLKFFGLRIQSAVQEAIARRPNGMLPVGACIVVRSLIQISGITARIPHKSTPLVYYTELVQYRNPGR